MTTKRHLAFVGMTAVLLTGACFQSLDTNAAGGSTAGAQTTQGGSSWQICQAPSCDSPTGEVPVNLDAPPIFLADGRPTFDPCEEVRAESIRVRKTYCAGCHESPAGQDGLSFILEDDQLATAYSQTATNPDGTPQRLLIPGQPYASRIYQRAAAGLGRSAAGMPPATLAGYPSIPRPAVSDVSVLYTWIAGCVAVTGADAGGD